MSHRSSPSQFSRSRKKLRGDKMTGHSKELSKAELKSFMALCPPELGPKARDEWERIVPTLSTLKLLKNIDLAAVALYCSSFAGWLSAVQAIQEFGAVIKT